MSSHATGRFLIKEFHKEKEEPKPAKAGDLDKLTITQDNGDATFFSFLERWQGLTAALREKNGRELRVWESG